MAVISGVRQVGPLFWRRQLVRLKIVLIPHQAITADGKAKIFAVGIVNWKTADLSRDARHDLFRRGVFFQQSLRFECLKRVRGAYPEDIRLRLGLGLAQIRDTGVGLLAVDDDCDARMFSFKGFLVGLKQFLRERCNDDNFLCHRRSSNKIKDEPNQPEANAFHKTSFFSEAKNNTAAVTHHEGYVLSREKK